MGNHKHNSRSSKTIAKALLVLEAFSGDQPTWGVRSLADHLSINPTTIHRILVTFEEFDYLTQNVSTKRYSLGPRVLRLASAYNEHNPLPFLAEEVFKEYRNEWPYNFGMGILIHHEVAYATVISGDSPIKIIRDSWDRDPLYTNSLGKVLLAYQSDEFINDYLNRMVLKSRTPKTITNRSVLWQQIEDIRRQGYSVNQGENYENIAAIGAPVFEEGKVIAAISLIYPNLQNASPITDEKRVIDLVRAITKEVTRRYSGF